MSQTAETALLVSWLFSGLGLGLWIYGWLAVKDPIKRQRMSDCGMVLISGSILLRVALDPNRSPIDWIMAVLAPLFMLAALWRLSQTGGRT
ncbi:MAG TPA: hypothetical protein VGB49_07440 [Caulobacteraceae bacterium]|jgi:hypothetical protein